MWPHAAAYKTVWDNCETVLNNLGQQLHGSFDNHNQKALSVRSGIVERHTVGRKSQDIDLETYSTLTFRFNRVYSLRYLCGITVNEHTVGYIGDDSNTALTTQWTGLRLVSDGHGFVFVQVRDGSEWQDVTPMDPLQNSKGDTSYCEIEWSRGSKRGTLDVSLDVGEDLFVSVLDITDLLGIQD